VARKGLIILAFFIVAVLAAMGYLYRHGKQAAFADPLSAVGADACFVIETRDLQSFLNSLTTGKGLFGEITKMGEFSVFTQKLRFLADIMNKPSIRELPGDGSSVIACFPSRNGELHVMISIAVPSGIRYRHIKQGINSTGISNISDLSIGGETVLSLPYSLNGENDSLFVSLNNGLILIADKKNIIAEANNTLDKKNDIRNVPGFTPVYTASGKNEDEIFILFNNLPNVIKPLLSWDNQQNAVRVKSIAAVSAGDIYLNEDGITISGYTNCTDTTQYLNKFRSIQPSDLKTYKILPASTALFETIRLSPDYHVSGSLGIISVINMYAEEELTRAYLDIRENSPADNVLILYRLKDANAAEQAFLEKSGASAKVLYFKPDDQVMIRVYKVPFTVNADMLSNKAGEKRDSSYMAFYDNYLVSGTSYNTVSRLLYENMLNNTLENDLVYRDFESSLPSRASYFFFCIPSKINRYLEELVSENIIGSLSENMSSLNKIQAIGYRLSPGNGMIYNSLSVKFRDEIAEESLTEWETLLDTTAATKPFFFTNHLTGAKEIFVQDVRNNIYLINAAGRVLWKVALKEHISESIYMIDYYGNGKYQLLFAGKNYLHLIDRNGNYVERFPVKLRSPSTNSLALFDYDDTKNYRLLIAGEDRNIYSYDKSGNVVKGWKLFRTQGVVKTQLSYFQVSGKDYIAASDDKSIYLLDRYGNRRVTFREPVVKALGSTLKLNKGRETYLVCTSPQGDIQQIFLDGTVKKFRTGSFSADHSFDLFDIDGDGADEFVFLDRGNLFLFDNDRSEMFSRDLGSLKILGPICFNFSADDRQIGVLDTEQEQVYLFDQTGEVMRGLPLKGASMFSIGKLTEKSGWHLIVGGPDKFLYNYNIEVK
jgi:WD40 repeat protein